MAKKKAESKVYTGSGNPVITGAEYKKRYGGQSGSRMTVAQYRKWISTNQYNKQGTGSSTPSAFSMEGPEEKNTFRQRNSGAIQENGNEKLYAKLQKEEEKRQRERADWVRQQKKERKEEVKKTGSFAGALLGVQENENLKAKKEERKKQFATDIKGVDLSGRLQQRRKMYEQIGAGVTEEPKKQANSTAPVYTPDRWEEAWNRYVNNYNRQAKAAQEERAQKIQQFVGQTMGKRKLDPAKGIEWDKSDEWKQESKTSPMLPDSRLLEERQKQFPAAAQKLDLSKKLQNKWNNIQLIANEHRRKEAKENSGVYRSDDELAASYLAKKAQEALANQNLATGTGYAPFEQFKKEAELTGGVGNLQTEYERINNAREVKIKKGMYNDAGNPWYMNDEGLIAYINRNTELAQNYRDEIKAFKTKGADDVLDYMDQLESGQYDNIISGNGYTVEEKQQAAEEKEKQQQTLERRRNNAIRNLMNSIDTDYLNDESMAEPGSEGGNWDLFETWSAQVVFESMFEGQSYRDYVKNLTKAEKEKLDALLLQVKQNLIDTYKVNKNPDDLERAAKAFETNAEIAKKVQAYRARLATMTGQAEDIDTTGEYDPSMITVQMGEWEDGSPFAGENLNRYLPQGSEIDQSYFWMNFNISDAKDTPYNMVSLVHKEMFATPEMVGTFNKYYKYDKIHGTKTAQNFLDAITPYLNQRMTEYNDYYHRRLAETPVVGAVARIASPVTNAIGGVTGSAARVAALLGNKSAQEPWSAWYEFSNSAQKTRDQQNSKWDEQAGGKGVLKFALGVVDSIADNLFTMAVGAGVTGNIKSKAAGAIVQGLMSGEATANTFVQKMEEGEDPTTAAMYAIADGAIEFITEKVSWDHFIKGDMRAMLGDKKKLWKYIAEASLVEGAEEINADLLNLGVDYLISITTGHEQEMQKRYREIISQYDDPTGHESEVARQVFWEKVKEIGLSGLAGLVSGFALSGMRAATSNMRQSITGKAIRTQGSGNALINVGLQAKEGSYTQEQAKRLQQKQQQGKKISRQELGRLSQSIIVEGQEQVGQTAEKVRNDSIRKMLKDGKVQDAQLDAMTDLVARALDKGGIDYLSKKERSTLNGNKAALNTYYQFRMNEQTKENVKQETAKKEAGTIKSFGVVQNILDGIGQKKNVQAAPQIKTQYEITEKEASQAEGTRTEGSRGVVVNNGQTARHGQLLRVHTNENGETVYDVKIGDKTETVTSDQIGTTNKGTSVIIQSREENPLFFNDAYTNKLIQEMDIGKLDSKAYDFMAAAVAVRLAAFTEEAMPKTNIQDDVAQRLYEQSKIEHEANQENNIKDATPVKPGQGTAFYKNTEYGTKEFEQAISKLSAEDQETIRTYSALAKAAGIRVDFVDNADVEASAEESMQRYKGNAYKFWGHENGRGITLNIEGRNVTTDLNTGEKSAAEKHNVGVTFGHEFIHWLQSHTKNGYRAIAKYVMEEQRRRLGRSALNTEIMYRMEANGWNLDTAISEMVAESCDSIFGNKEVLQHIEQTNKGLYQDIKNFVKDLVQKVSRAMKGMAGSLSKNSMRMLNSDMSRLAKLVNEAWDEAVTGEYRNDVKTDKNGDVVYSQALEDAEGLNLTEGQRNYFDGTYAVDENGRLLQLYHGTLTGGFTVFKPYTGLNFFTTRKMTAQSYSGTQRIYTPSKVHNWNDFARNLEGQGYQLVNEDGYQVIVDAAMPDSAVAVFAESQLDAAKDWLYKETQGRQTYATYLKMTHPLIIEGNQSGWMAVKDARTGETHSTNEWALRAKQQGYDGVIFRNIYDGGTQGPAENNSGYYDVYVVFESNQIKSINNENPTANDDIRYSQALDDEYRGILQGRSADHIRINNQARNAIYAKYGINENDLMFGIEFTDDGKVDYKAHDEDEQKLIRKISAADLQKLYQLQQDTEKWRMTWDDSAELNMADYYENWEESSKMYGPKPVEKYGAAVKRYGRYVSLNTEAYATLDEKALDREYADAVARGDMRHAEEMLVEKLKRVKGIVAFRAPHGYAGSHQAIAKQIKTNYGDAVAKAVDDMAPYVPENAVLVPMPPSTGEVKADTDTNILAHALSEATGRPVVRALTSNPRDSRYKSKQAGMKGPSAEQMGFRKVGDVDGNMIPVFVDNVVGSGETAKAASAAMGGGITLAYAKSTRSTAIQGLKSLTVTYDSNGQLIPLSERLDPDNPSIKYSQAQVEAEGDELTLPALDIARDIYFKGTDAEIDAAERKMQQRAEELERIIEDPEFTALMLRDKPGGRYEILHPSTRKGIRYQLTYYPPDGIPSMHESYGRTGESVDPNETVHSMQELYKHFVNMNFDSALEMNVMREGRANQDQTNQQSVRYSRAGVDPETGRTVYISSFAPNTPETVKRNALIQFIQNIWSKKPIKLKITENHKTRTIEARYNPDYDVTGTRKTDVGKMAYPHYGPASARRAMLNLANDYYDILENSSYLTSANEEKNHENVLQWHYFINDIYYADQNSDDAIPYRIKIDVKEMTDGSYVYNYRAIPLKKQQIKKLSVMGIDPVNTGYKSDESAPAFNNNITQDAQNNKQKFSQALQDAETRYAIDENDPEIKNSQWTNEGMDVHQWIMNQTPGTLQTEDERAMWQAYKDLRISMSLAMKRIADYQEKIKRLEDQQAKVIDGRQVTLTAEERDELTALRNRLEIQQKKLADLDEQMVRVTSADGFAGMMYRANMVLGDYVQGKTQDQVRQTVEEMLKQVKKAQEQMAKDRAELQKLAETQAVKSMKSFLGKTSLSKAAATLRKAYNSSLSKAEIENRLAEMALKQAAGKDITADTEALAQDLLDKMRGIGSEELDYIRGTTLNIGESILQEYIAEQGLMDEVRKNDKEDEATVRKRAERVALQRLRVDLKGSGVKIVAEGKSRIREQWNDLRENNMALVELSSNEMEAFHQIMDYIYKKIQESRGVNQQEYDFDEVALMVRANVGNVATYLVNDPEARKQITSLMHQIKELSQKTEKTTADMEALDRQLEDVVTAGMRAKGWTTVLQRDTTEAIRYYNKMAKVAAQYEKTQVRKALIEQLRNENTKKLIDQETKFREKLKHDERARELVEDNLIVRRKISTVASRLATRIFAETDTKNVPEETKALVRKVISMLAMHDAAFRRVTFWNKQQLADIQQRLIKMQATFGPFDMETDLNWLVSGEDTTAKDAVARALMDIESGLLEYRTAEGQGNITLNDRKTALEKVQKAISTIWNVVKARSELELDGRMWQVYEMAEIMQQDMENSRFKGERVGFGAKARTTATAAVNYGNLTPEYFFKRLKNKALNMLHNGLKQAENRGGLEAAAARQRIAQIAAETGFATWDGQQKHTVNTRSGPVQMTTEQIMALYATWMREKNQMRPEETAHLLQGGFVLSENNDQKKPGREKRTQRPIRMNEAQLNALAGYLTENQLKFVEEIVSFMSNEMAALGNEASMKMYGVKKFTEQFYFPIKSWGGVLNKSSDAGVNNKNENRAAQQGFSKRVRTNARNAIEIGDFTPTAMKHIVGMITYNTIGPAVENMNKVLNQQLQYGEVEGDEDNTYKRNMRAAFEEAYGKQAYDYMVRFLKDVNGGITADRSPFDKLLSIFKKNAVAGSLSVAAQQPLSYIRAAMLVNPKYLAEALSPKYWKGSYAEMMKYSGVAVIKEMGKFDMNYGRTMQEYITPEGMMKKSQKAWNKVTDAMTALPAKTDAMTWTRMWTAVKLEMMEQNKGMDFTSDAFLEKVADRFNELMRRTQVYDSVMVKSQNMRSTSRYAKIMTSFMAEPTLSLNVLEDAMMNVKEKGGKANVAKAFATFMLSAAAQAGVKALFGTGRSPKKDKNREENFISKFWYNFLSEANPLALIPGYRQLVEVLTNGEINDDAMGVIGKAKEAFTNLIELMTGDVGKKGLYRKLEDSVGQLVQMITDVPAKNIMRDFRAMVNFFSNGNAEGLTGDTYAQRPTSSAVIRYDFLETLLTNDLIGELNKRLGNAGYGTKNDDYYQRIFEAERAGNTGKAEEMKEFLLLGKGASQKKMNEELRKMYRADDTLSTEEQLEKQKEYGLKQTTSIVLDDFREGRISWKEAKKLYKQENPNADDKKLMTTLDKIEWEKAGKDVEGFTAYTPLYAAIENNKAEEIRQVVNHMLENGYKSKDIKKQIGDKYKQSYLEATGDEKRRMMDALTKAYKAIGLSGEEALKIINGWKKGK